MNRYILRKEYFGSLLFDRQANDIEYFNLKETLILDALKDFTQKDIIKAFEGILNPQEIKSFINKWKKNGLLDKSNKIKAKVIDAQKKLSILQAPLKIHFNVTNRCNLNCPHCSSDSSTAKHTELSLNSIENIFKELSNIGVFKINITGGEPFVRDDILDILSLGEKYGISLSLTTNAILITKRIAKKLAGIPLEYIAISLDGAKPETHEFTRGKNTFSKVFKALKLLKENTNHQLSLKFTITSKNKEEIEDFLKLAEKCSYVDMMAFGIIKPAGRAIENNKMLLTPDEYRKIIQRVNKLAVKSSKTIFTPYSFSDDGSIKLYNGFGCGAGIVACNLSADGFLLPCNYFTGKQWSGESVENKSIQEIWLNNESFTNLRNLKGNKHCSSCTEFNNCRGYCRASAWNLYGDINAPDYLCMCSPV